MIRSSSDAPFVTICTTTIQGYESLLLRTKSVIAIPGYVVYIGSAWISHLLALK